jgi:uncharacterized damage-inducible protein DinB
MKRITCGFFFAVCCSVFLVAVTPAAQAQMPAAPTSGFRADFLHDWDDLANKAVRLAQAMPAEKYTWRPGPGVYSVSEIYLHLANGNFGLPRAIGIQPPAGIDLRTLMTSTTDKAKVVELLKQSFDHVREAVLKTSDADLAKPATMFGQATTVENVLYTLGTHQHEHFGLTIAYARMNGVVPPWTAERQAQHQHEPAKQPEKPKP